MVPGPHSRTQGRGIARDAAGKPVTIMDPGVDWLLGSNDRIERETLDAIMADLGVADRSARRVILTGLGTLAVLIVLAIAGIAIDIAIEGQAAWNDLVKSLAFTGPAVLLMLAAGVAAPLVVARRARLKGTRAALLRHGRCPHCGYGIAGVPVDAGTGHTICPECSSAWHVTPPGVPPTYE
ncbi:MAG: hypothetical protein AMXMBFR58_37640 [Phycisphaerae bacterium]|nr:hypothetical protein [Phycisphaerales bacterium]